MDEVRHVVERYVSRGQPRGAMRVLDRARDSVDDYVAGDPVERHAPRRPLAPAVAAAAVVVLVAAGAVLAVAQRGPTEDPVRTGVAPGSAPPGQIVDSFRAQVERGWVRWAVQPLNPDPSLPAEAWTPTGGWTQTGGPADWPESVAQGPSGGVHRLALFDEPGGTLLGYHYANLGFIPAAVADAPGFDVAPLYRERGMCPPGDAC